MERKRLLPDTADVGQKRPKPAEESPAAGMNPIDLSRKKASDIITLSDDEEQEIQQLAAKGDPAADPALQDEQNAMIKRLQESLRNEECKLVLLKSMRHSQRAGSGHAQVKDAASALSAARAASGASGAAASAASALTSAKSASRPSGQSSAKSQQATSRTATVSGKSGSSSGSKAAQPQITQAQLDAQKAQKKLALRKQLEKSLLEIPNPQPPPSELNFIPSTVTNEFIALVGLEEVVRNIGEYENVLSGGKPTEVKYVFSPFSCVQCGTDYTPVWKRDKPGSKDVICEQCMGTNQKSTIRKEHTARLKSAFVKALKQEEEIEKEFKRYSANPQLATQAFPHLVASQTQQPQQQQHHHHQQQQHHHHQQQQQQQQQAGSQSATLAAQRTASNSNLTNRMSANAQSSQAAAVAAVEQMQRQHTQLLQAQLQAMVQMYPAAAAAGRSTGTGSYPYSMPANYLNMLQQAMQQTNFNFNTNTLWSALSAASQQASKK